MKKLTSLMLVVVMLVTAVPFCTALSAFAASELENSIIALVGEEPADPWVETEFSSAGYIPGGNLTVKLTVTNISSADIVAFAAESLVYDSSVLTLANGVTSNGSVDCITAAPGSEWKSENYCQAETLGEVVLSVMGGVQYPEQVLTSGDTLEFTLKFDVSEDASGEVAIYIPHSAISCAEAEALGMGTGLGGYIIVNENTSGEIPDEDVSEEASEDSSEDVSEEVSSDSSEDVSDEPYIPSEKEDEVLALMGEAPSNPLARIEISAPRYVDGAVLEVSVSVHDIIEGGLNSMSIEKFTYNTTKLELLNAVESSGALDCITECPGSDWRSDNFSKIESDGTITLAALGGLADESQLLTPDKSLVFTLRFRVMEGTTDELVFYAPHESVMASKANDIYALPCESDYLIVHHKCALGHTPGAEADCENAQTCTACGEELAPALGHDYDAVVTEPDCVNSGYTTHTCTNCGDSYVTDEVSALGHTPGAAADCENAQTCTVCGDELAPALGHDYDAVVTEPDCENGGYTTYTCTTCGDSYVADEVGALGHDYNGVVTEPDCVNGGYTTYTCTACGDSYVADEVEALGHDYDAVVTEPDCENGGYTTYTCTNCGDSYVADEVEALGHDYDAVVTEPDCENGGYTTYTCTTCGDSYVADEVEALGHTPGAAADCENAQNCTVCGEELAPALGHDYDAVVTEPDCVNGGYTTYTCTTCGDSYVADEVEALGHTPGAAADCENAQNCTVCGEELAPALGHDYESVVTEPTCTEGGYTTYTCANCGDSYVADEVEALGHDYDAVVTEPDCVNGGYTTYTCTACGDSYVADEVEALGHDYNGVVTEPDCENGGYTTYTCINCGDSYVADETEAHGHGEGEWITLENNDKELRCEHCGLVLDIDLWCDVNQDGKVNMFDYILVKSIYFEKQDAPEIHKQRADLTGDGRVNMFDYIIVKNFVLDK